MTKIAWIADYNPLEGQGGGAELSEKAVILEGIRKGHEINLFIPNTPQPNEVLNADFVIIGNASRWAPNLLSKVIEQQEVVNYVHDFSPLCHYRLFFPDLEKCKTTCPNLLFTKKMMLNSSLNIFLSPLHYKVWKRVLPELEDVPHYLHVSTVDTSLFKPLDVPKVPNSALCVNCLLKFKDLDNVIKYANENTDKTITCVGGKEDKLKLPQNIVYIGGVPNAQLPGMYSQTEAFFHCPSTVEPCGRSTIEAKLCGVPKLILNKLVGVASYKEFKYDREEFAQWVEDSPKRFWKAIEKEVL
jgi:glycosyltransferase involved in cell wall biosynthesis